MNLNTDNVLGPIHFQSSTGIKEYPRQSRASDERCHHIALNKMRSVLRWTREKATALIQKPLRSMIFYASSTKFHTKLDDVRLEESREVLRRIGGLTQVLKTSDGAVLETMYFNAHTFKERICELGGQFKLQQSITGKHQQVLYVYTTQLKQLCDRLNLLTQPRLGRGWVATLTRPPVEASPLLTESAPGVTILTQGNACIFEFDRARITSTLLNGGHCMVYNLRGTGRSKGAPSEYGSYRDLETVYQYLTQVKNFYNYQITVIGYCLGGGASTELAKNHPGVNLTMDRCFISMGDMIAGVVADAVSGTLGQDEQKAAKTKQLSRRILKPVVDHLIFGYNNAGKLPEVRGSVCIVDAAKDDVIPRDAGNVLRQGVQSRNHANLTLAGDHCDSWDTRSLMNYSRYLQGSRRLRDFGNTPEPAEAVQFSDLRALGLLGSLETSSVIGSRAAFK